MSEFIKEINFFILLYLFPFNRESHVRETEREREREREEEREKGSELGQRNNILEYKVWPPDLNYSFVGLFHLFRFKFV